MHWIVQKWTLLSFCFNVLFSRFEWRQLLLTHRCLEPSGMNHVFCNILYESLYWHVKCIKRCWYMKLGLVKYVKKVHISSISAWSLIYVTITVPFFKSNFQQLCQTLFFDNFLSKQYCKEYGWIFLQDKVNIKILVYTQTGK